MSVATDKPAYVNIDIEICIVLHVMLLFNDSVSYVTLLVAAPLDRAALRYWPRGHDAPGCIEYSRRPSLFIAGPRQKNMQVGFLSMRLYD